MPPTPISLFVAKRVLLVEDDRALAASLERAIVAMGYECHKVFDGDAALQAVSKDRPDLVLLDLLLPKKDGHAVLDVLQGAELTRGIPVLVMSGVFRGGGHARALQQKGACDLIEKPFSARELAAQLRQHVGAPDPPVSKSEVRQAVSLSARSVAELIWGAMQRSFCGALHFQHGKRHKVLLLAEGRPVCIRSNLARESLGRRLLATGRIDEETLAEVVRRAKQSGKRQGEVLIEMGAVRSHELEESLGTLGAEKLLELFGWAEGECWEQDGVSELSLSSPLEGWTPYQVILRGAERMDAARLASGLEPYRGAAVTRGAVSLGADETTALTTSLLAKLKPGVIVADLLDGAAPALYGLWLIGALHFAGTERPGAEVPASGSKEKSDARRSVERLRKLLEEHRSMTHFEVLGVAKDASETEVRSAYLRLAKLYHPDRFKGQSGDAPPLAVQVFARVSDAYDTLSDSQRRREYLAELRTGSSAEDGRREVVQVMNAERQFQQGELLLGKRDYEQALDCFRWALELDPNQGDFHALYGWTLYLGRPEDEEVRALASESLEKAVALAPSSPTGYYYLGKLRKACGDLEEAERMFQRVLELRPDHREAGQELRLFGMRRQR